MLTPSHALLAALLLQLSIAVTAPEQVHLALSSEPSSMSVSWLTKRTGSAIRAGSSLCEYGVDSQHLSARAAGFNASFGERIAHTCLMINLQPLQRYYYRVGDPLNGWSDVFWFTSPGSGNTHRYPLKVLFIGDMGEENARSLPSLQREVEQSSVDFVIHAGDIAYDLDYAKGTMGDRFLRRIEPLASRVAYMTCLGNHEANDKFVAYTMRFQGQPSNSPRLPASLGAPLAGMPNNWFYSFNSGIVHWVAISSEVYYFHPELVEWQFNWLVADLAAANANRSAAPWIIVYGHRPMYCSCVDPDCRGDNPLRDGLLLANGSRAFGIEQLLFRFGVDLYLSGHEHNYERNAAVYHGSLITAETDGRVVNPKATVHITSGSAGNREELAGFVDPQPEYSAFRAAVYSYSRLLVHNATHLLWQQVQPPAEAKHGRGSRSIGHVIDSFWLVQFQHRAFF